MASNPTMIVLLTVLIALTRTVTTTDIQIVHACEGETLRIDCGEKFIKIWSALYGRVNPTICPHATVSSQQPYHCRADKSNFESMRHCDHKTKCEIKAESTAFGDPCGDTMKYLQVEYYCRTDEGPSKCNPKDSPTYKTKYECDNKDMVLECPNPGEVIKILDANYGRQGSNVDCEYKPGIDDIFCDDESGESFEHVCLQCRGQQECTIPVSPQEFRDRCFNTTKYLSVQYVCIQTEQDSEEEESEEELVVASDDVIKRPTKIPRRRTTAAAITTTTPVPFGVLGKGKAVGGINVDQKQHEGSWFNFHGGSIPKGSATGKIDVDKVDQEGTDFKFEGPSMIGPGSATGGIDRGKVLPGGGTFNFNGSSYSGLSGLSSLYTYPGGFIGQGDVLMKIIVKYDETGQKYFTLKPLNAASSVDVTTGGSEYLMRVNINNVDSPQYTFKSLLEEFNRGISFYNDNDEVNVPFQFTVGNGQESFFSALFQMIIETDSNGKMVTTPSNPSSNFQVILDGGNKQIIDYLMTFDTTKMDQTLRSELINHRLFIPLKFYNTVTKQTEEIRIPFYVNFDGLEGSLSALFKSVQRPLTQFGMKYQVVGADGTKQIITLPFTLIEENGRQKQFLTLPTCTAYKMYGFVADKEYIIDPDGINSGLEPFVVNCNMEKGETVISHDRTTSTVASYPAGKNTVDVDINYEGATSEQLIALRKVSEKCTQEMTHKCMKKSPHFLNGKAYIWWEGLDGVKRENWGTATDVKMCHCGEKGACQVQSSLCNCDDGEGASFDSGTLEDKDTLPVRKVVFEKPAAEQGNDNLEVGKFRCGGDQTSSTLEFFIFLNQMLAKPLRTCEEFKKKGYELDGVYLIDPDQDGGERPFTVFCQMEKQRGITVVHHDLSDQRTEVNGYAEPGSYSRSIGYRATLRQIDHLKAVSGKCEQDLMYECQGSAFHVGTVLNHWWVSFDGEKMKNWGGAPCDFDGCACKVNSSCVDNLKCNCDKDDSVMRKDGGKLDDKDKLPVTQLRFGDTGNAGDLGYFTLGPLKCWNDSQEHITLRYPLKSCSEIKTNDPSAKSGNYYIKPSQHQDYFLVYCDMSVTEGMTVLYPDKGVTLQIDGFYEEPGTWSRSIQYGASDRQLKALTTLSASCEQFISHGCFGSLHHSTETGKMYTWWESRTGAKMTNWGDVADGCECSVTNTCKGGPNTKCNCDVNTQSYMMDEGYLRDKSSLPVSGIRSGDVSDDKGLEYGTAKLGPLMCKGYSGTVLQEEVCDEVKTEITERFLPEKDFDDFQFEVRGTGKAVVNLATARDSYSSYRIEIGLDAERSVSVSLCEYDKCCSKKEEKSFSANSNGRFTLRLLNGDIILGSEEEELSFTMHQNGEAPLDVKYFTYKTEDGVGYWKFGCYLTKYICKTASDTIQCPNSEPNVRNYKYGVPTLDPCTPRVRNSSCTSMERMDKTQVDKLCVANNRCHYVMRNPGSVSVKCSDDQNILTVVYDCNKDERKGRTLGSDPCKSKPCQNSGKCNVLKDNTYSCSCPNLFEGTHCEIEMVECSALGDPHYKTFLKKTFDFQGNCTYILAQECQENDDDKPGFQVLVKNRSPPLNYAVSSTDSVEVLFDGVKIEMKQDGEVFVDGILTSQRAEKDTYTLKLNEDSIELQVKLHEPNYNLTVQWNNKDIATVILPKDYPKDVCGLCGHTTRDQGFLTRDGDPAEDLTTFGNSWQTDRKVCVANTDVTNANSWSLDKIPDADRLKAAEFCSAISLEDPFAEKCPEMYSTRETYKNWCIYDHWQKNKENSCSFIKIYMAKCTLENSAVMFPSEWLTIHSDCKNCPEHLTYIMGPQACRRTCETLLFPQTCSKESPMGCHCPNGAYEEGGDSCVEKEQCGCKWNGEYYKLGSSVLDSDCETNHTCLKGPDMQITALTDPLCLINQNGGDLTHCDDTGGVYKCACKPPYVPSSDRKTCITKGKSLFLFSGRQKTFSLFGRRKRTPDNEECNAELSTTEFKASSIRNPQSLAEFACLGAPNSWRPRRNNDKQWIWVDIQIPAQIAGVTTWGGQEEKNGRVKDAWVTSYGVDISMNGRTWTPVHSQTGHRQFFGNTDSTTPKSNMFKEMDRARYVRIIPMSWNRHIRLKFAVIGCEQQCETEIGAFPINRHISSDNWFVVNTAETITCTGVVKSWKVIRARNEPFEAWVLRPKASEPTEFMLVGSTHIPAGQVDEEVEFELDQDQRIPVQTGDVVGFLYGHNPLYSSEEGKETVDFLWVHTRDITQFEMMRAGSKIKFTEGPAKRAFSAIAVLEPSSGVAVSPVLCQTKMGLNAIEKRIPDTAFSASSRIKGHGASRGRLDIESGQGGGGCGWTPKRRDRNPWLQVDLGDQQKLSGIVTQGGHSSNNKKKHWVRRYFVQFSQDADHWKFITKPNGRPRKFYGNKHKETTNYLEEPIVARYVRIRPKNPRRKRIGLRVEFLGCPESDPCSSSPCKQGGTCKQASGLDPDGYVCKCPQGWTGKNCEAEEGVCRSAGDSHYNTFDGRHFYFPGECIYTLAKDCAGGENPAFDIVTNNAPTGRQIDVITNGIMFEFKQEGVVHVDGEACKLPIKRYGVSVIHNALTGVLLETTYGLSVEWDGHHRAIISLPSSFGGAVCGLCGNFNGNKDDDINENMTETQFGESLSINSEECGECEKCKEAKPCEQHPDKLVKAKALCNPIMDTAGPFASCHGVLSPDYVYDDCLEDICDSDLKSIVPVCTQLAEYADACALNGVIIESWRKKDLCAITCPVGMVYNPCGSACPATCGDPHAPNTCTKACEETCECPEGLLKEGNKMCLEPSSCGCTDNGCYFERDSTFYRLGCTERGLCGINGEVVYIPAECGENAQCGSRNGVYGCFCNDGFSGDGQVCQSVMDDAPLLVCEEEELSIFCAPGETIIINEAIYGRNKDFQKCPSTKQPRGVCDAESALSVTRTKCQGKESCILKVSSEIYGDPCYGVKKYLEVDYQCSSFVAVPPESDQEIMKRVCQGDNMEIDCGDLFVEIVSAVYGRLTDGQVCPGGNIQSTDCIAASSLGVVQDLCQGEHKCTSLQAANHVFGVNPCAKTFKYLEVKYKCNLDVMPRDSGNLNPCALEPCKNGGQCVTVHTSEGFKCTCSHGWTGPTCENEEITCRVAGLSHFLDFNEQSFTFLGDSKYILAESCMDSEHKFRVMIKMARFPIKNEVSAVEDVHVHYDDRVVELKQEHKVLVDRRRASTSFNLNFGKIKLCHVGNYLLLRTDFGMIVSWDGLHRVQLKIPDVVARKSCGLCGTYQGISAEPAGFVNSGGNKVDDKQSFGSSWRVAADPPAFVHTNLIDTPACMRWPENLNYAEYACSSLKNENQYSPFKSCFGKVNSARYYENCLYDLCATLPSLELSCQSLAEYADACLDENVKIENWRTNVPGLNCAMVCPKGQEYKACIQPCPKSCGEPHAGKEPVDRCYEGCACKAGEDLKNFQDGDQCLPQSKCGCTRLGVYYPPGERVVNEGCTGQFVCLPGGDWDAHALTCDLNAQCGVVNNNMGCICNPPFIGNGKRCYSNADVINEQVTQGRKFDINCGTQYVDIVSGTYSVVDRGSAGASTDRDCLTDNTLDVLANHIIHGNRLKLRASAVKFGDTCQPINNVLNVTYLCVDKPPVHEVEHGRVVHMRACQNRMIQLKCKKGQKMQILSAKYGRNTGCEVCPSTRIFTTSCLAPQKETLNKLERHCRGRDKCIIHVNNRRFFRNDPCRGTDKYLDVTFKCTDY